MSLWAWSRRQRTISLDDAVIDTCRAIHAMMRSTDDVRLDSPVYAALTGAHARFAQVRGQAVRYPADVAPFLALPAEATPRDWVDASHLVPSGTFAAVQRTGAQIPDGWTVVREFEVLQMVEDNLDEIDDPEALALGPAHVPEMLKLVRDTDPGPFLERTIELGRYVGLRHGGELIAMAGERIHFTGWREISAVCTAPANRGQGLASRLVSTIAYGIHRRHERAFLNVLNTNTDAIRLYERLGFCIRSSRTLAIVTPGPDGDQFLPAHGS
jgi:ribosomal protein S18 acetylase RimI-like enzyme